MEHLAFAPAGADNSPTAEKLASGVTCADLSAKYAPEPGHKK
jgi:hypothetical protein